MKKNKKGVELTINFIVIMIIGLLILGVATYFIYKTSKNVLRDIDSFPKLEIPPDIDNPIQFIPSAIERGKSNKMTIGFYNNEVQDITKNVLPKIKCDLIANIKVQSIGLYIPVGQKDTYVALVTVPANTPPDIYACILTISKTEKAFFMEVK